MCGEKTGSAEANPFGAGSPPRVRGKVNRLCFAHYHFQHGITPACAGKSARKRSALGGGRDHPRVCGEKLFYLNNSLVVLGSPPRVRGKVQQTTITLYLCRITPACAGKSKTWNTAGKQRWDHPRVCGEKKVLKPMQTAWSGSPPRVRGKALKLPRP